jgi:DNA-binding PadR family transcriptional regulator
MRKSTETASRKPLSQPVIYILLALAEGDRHGYAIKQEVESRTEGAIRLGPSTLYEAIQRLLDGGLIEEAEPAARGTVNGQEAQRRYYRLTERGWSVLRDEIRQLGQIVDYARSNPRVRKGLA